jgi:hypothetical protein
MIINNQTRFETKTALFIFILLSPGLLFCQIQKGRVLSSETHTPVGFVNIGIIGRNIGTVADINGDYELELDNKYNSDSVRFSMIGYESIAFLISQFRENPEKNVYLNPRSYNLQEVKVVYHKPKSVKLGYPVTTTDLRSGFSYNELGSELGIKIHVKGQVKLTEVNFNVGICTYDSVTYRLNIYLMEGQTDCINILKKPIYITFSKHDIDKPINLDLSKYSVVVEGDILVTLEIYRNLGQGRLLFNTTYFTGETYHKKTSEGQWTKSPGLIGMYLKGLLIRN